MRRHAISRARRARDGRGGRGGGRGSNGVIGRTGQIPVARHWSASVLSIKILPRDLTAPRNERQGDRHFHFGPGGRRIFAAQPSPTDPDGEHQDQGQRQRWSELDAEQEVGHRRYADAIVEARAHFSCFGVVEAGDMVSVPSAGTSNGDSVAMLAIACQSSVFPRQTEPVARASPSNALSAGTAVLSRRRRPQRAVETVGRVGRCGRLQRRLSFTPSSAHGARARRPHGEPRGCPTRAQSTRRLRCRDLEQIRIDNGPFAPPGVLDEPGFFEPLEPARGRQRGAVVSAPFSIRELASAVLPRRWREGGMLLMLKAYFDDAGTHNGSPIAVMGGLIGTVPNGRD